MLRHIMPFIECLEKETLLKSIKQKLDRNKQVYKEELPSFPASILLSNIFTNLNLDKHSQAIIGIIRLRYKLSGGRFNNSQQQDAQEFLTCLIQTMNEELDRSPKEQEYKRAPTIKQLLSPTIEVILAISSMLNGINFTDRSRTLLYPPTLMESSLPN